MNGTRKQHRESVERQLGHQGQERWFDLLLFLREWHRPVGKEDGLPLDRVQKAEIRLGFQLPLALREWYTMSGRRSCDETRGTNVLRKPEELVIYDGALVFYDESQGTVAWGILENSLALEDPPVFIEGDYANVLPGPGWYPENSTVSEFIFQMEACDTIVHADQLGLCASGVCNHVIAQEIRSILQKIGSDWHWPSFPTEFYRSSDLLVELGQADTEFYSTGMTDVSVAALSKDSLFRFTSQFPIDWEWSNQ